MLGPQSKRLLSLPIIHSNPSPIHSSPTFLQLPTKMLSIVLVYVAAEMITSDRHLLPAKDVTWADQAKTRALNPVVLSYAVKLAFPVHFIPRQNDMPCMRVNLNALIRSE